MLSQEQTAKIKKQLIEQIEKTFPQNQKQAAHKQIQSMSQEELEQFLIQNNLIQNNSNKDSAKKSETPQCIFCAITQELIHSYEIDSNKEAVAVLEINPISNGHALVIPKNHISQENEISKNVQKLAEKISKKIKTKLKPKNILTQTSKAFEHVIINIIPVYNEETLKSPRQKTTPEQLTKLQKKLEKKSSSKTLPRGGKPKTIKLKENIKLPVRIP